MILPAPVFDVIPGELPGARIARIVRAYDGCRLHDPGTQLQHPRIWELAALVGRGVNDQQMVTWQTNCATFALGVLSAAGLPCGPATKIGEAFSDLVRIGYSLNAWQASRPENIADAAHPGDYPVGALLWYRLDGTNDDHVEFFLGRAADGKMLHGGGGRADNAITVAEGEVDWSWGRPVWRWLEPGLLGLEVVEDAAQDVEPHT